MNISVVNQPKKLRILHIDNDLLMQKIVRRILPEDKFEIDAATDGKAAFNKLKKNDYQYDLILTEMLLPYFSGSQIISAVNGKSGGQIPVVVLSGVNYVHVEETLKVTRENYFQKPVNAGNLSGRLNTIWEKYITGDYTEQKAANAEGSVTYPACEYENNNEAELAEASVSDVVVKGNTTVYLNTEMVNNFDEHAGSQLLQSAIKRNTESHGFISAVPVGKVIFSSATNLVPDETVASFTDGKTLSGVNILYINEAEKAAVIESGYDVAEEALQNHEGLASPAITGNNSNSEVAGPVHEAVTKQPEVHTTIFNVANSHFTPNIVAEEVDNTTPVVQAVPQVYAMPVSGTHSTYLASNIYTQQILTGENIAYENGAAKNTIEAATPVIEIWSADKTGINGIAASTVLNGKASGAVTADKVSNKVPGNSIVYNGKWW